MCNIFVHCVKLLSEGGNVLDLTTRKVTIKKLATSYLHRIFTNSEKSKPGYYASLGYEPIYRF